MIKIKRRRKEQLTKEQWKELAKDYNAGKPIKEIQEKYSISRTHIYYILDKLEDGR